MNQPNALKSIQASLDEKKIGTCSDVDILTPRSSEEDIRDSEIVYWLKEQKTLLSSNRGSTTYKRVA